jgi:pimeloyl-ACP methyl ester carboxylesterase
LKLEFFNTGKANKETLLFVHGVGGNADQFQKQHDFFSSQYRVVSLSLRGHGDSPNPSPNTTDQYALSLLAGDIIRLIVELELDHIHFVGNSAGGILGFLVIHQIPHRFLSLTTFGTTGQMSLPRFLAPVVKALDAFMLRFFQKWYLRFVVKYAGINDFSREMAYQMFSKAVDAIPHMRYHLVNYDFIGVIEQCPIHYTLIKCEFDTDINRALGSTLKAISKNKKAKVVDLKGVGHLANLDKPEAFNTCLKGILESMNKKK